MKIWRGRPGLATRLGTIPFVCSLALGVTVPFVACSSEPLGSTGEQQAGALSLNLQVASGVTVNTVSYSITGNGFSKTGTIDTRGASSITGTIGGIPAGKSYTITLTATSAEGNATFSGSATFDVTLSNTESCGATNTTGMSESMRAMGPCFISAAG